MNVKITTDVPVPAEITNEQIKKCANIHYLEITKILRPPKRNYVVVTVITTQPEQLFLFGKNIGIEILYLQSKKTIK